MNPPFLSRITSGWMAAHHGNTSASVRERGRRSWRANMKGILLRPHVRRPADAHLFEEPRVLRSKPSSDRIAAEPDGSTDDRAFDQVRHAQPDGRRHSGVENGIGARQPGVTSTVMPRNVSTV